MDGAVKGISYSEETYLSLIKFDIIKLKVASVYRGFVD